MLMPARPVPALSLPTLDHGRFDLERDGGAKGTFLVFYRGLHCPICKKEMAALEERLDEFEALGIRVVAISADTAERARETAKDADVQRLIVAHDLPLVAARDDWGLYLSSAREGSAEPAVFSEPGHFFVLPDGTLFAAWVQTAPFSRPDVDSVLRMIGMQQDRNYPPRGTFEGALPGEA